MNLGLEGKRVLVTGASGALGRSMATTFVAEGARVIVGYHTRAEAAGQTAAKAERAGGQALLPPDLADEGSAHEAAARIGRAWGSIDVLVNKAIASIAGEPGDGMQLTGDRFTSAAAEHR